MEYSGEINLNLDQWFIKRCRLQILLFFSSGEHFLWQAKQFVQFF